MKKSAKLIAVWGLALVALSTMGVQGDICSCLPPVLAQALGCASTDCTALTVQNNTGHTLQLLYVAPTSSPTWGCDLLVDTTLADGFEIDVTVTNPTCDTLDVQGIDPTCTTFEVLEVNAGTVLSLLPSDQVSPEENCLSFDNTCDKGLGRLK